MRPDWRGADTCACACAPIRSASACVPRRAPGSRRQVLAIPSRPACACTHAQGCTCVATATRQSTCQRLWAGSRGLTLSVPLGAKLSPLTLSGVDTCRSPVHARLHIHTRLSSMAASDSPQVTRRCSRRLTGCSPLAFAVLRCGPGLPDPPPRLATAARARVPSASACVSAYIDEHMSCD